MIKEEVISELSRLVNSNNIIFVGLGNRNRGDDAAGLKLIDDLEHINPGLFISEEKGIESIILRIIGGEKNQKIIFIDACDLNASPGDITFMRLENINDNRISSHRLPISTLISLLKNKGKSAYLLGIQPFSLKFGNGISGSVESTLRELEDIIRKNLKN